MSTQATELAEMQSATERTQTVVVTERVVATAEDGHKTEVSVPKEIFIRPMPMRRWVQALGSATVILANLPNTGLDLNNPLQMVLWTTNLIGKIPDEIFALLELATDEKPALFDRIDLDDGAKVVMAVVEVNKDFFVQRVLPMLSELAPALKEKMGSILGQTQ